MGAKKIQRKEWQKYFDTFSKKYLKDQQPKYIEIQIFSEEMGVQHGTTWTILKGITYDPKSDILEIHIDKMDYMTSKPEEIYVEEMERDG